VNFLNVVIVHEGAKTTVSATTTPRASGSSESGAQRTTPRRTAAINAWCNNAVVDATVSIDNLIYVFRGTVLFSIYTLKRSDDNIIFYYFQLIRFL